MHSAWVDKRSPSPACFQTPFYHGRRRSGDFGRLFQAWKSIPTKIPVGQSDCRIALCCITKMALCEDGIPRLNISVPSAVVEDVLGALVQLQYTNPTEDEEATLDFSTWVGKSLCLRQSSVHFDNTRQYLKALRYCCWSSQSARPWTKPIIYTVLNKRPHWTKQHAPKQTTHTGFAAAGVTWGMNSRKACVMQV